MRSNAISYAFQLAHSGDISGAVAALRSAGDAGNLDAATELALWYLRGDIVSRNVALAREYLRRATAGGHPDAVMLEIALTGNGSGGKVDWSGAFLLLQQAASNNEWARHQLKLIEQLEIDQYGFPERLPAAELLDHRLPIFVYRDFLSAAERQHIAGVAVSTLQPSRVVDPKTGNQILNPIRSSDSTVLGPTHEDLVIQAINRRIAKATATDVTQGEPLSVLRYSPGQQYKLHYDAISGASNNRAKTVLLYLNDGYLGGQTIFPDLHLTFQPRAGDALVFDGLDRDGKVNILSRHAGLPVERGTKWLATRWIRLRPFDPWTFSGKN